MDYITRQVTLLKKARRLLPLADFERIKLLAYQYGIESVDISGVKEKYLHIIFTFDIEYNKRKKVFKIN